MTEKWHDGLADDAFLTETDKAYEKAAAAIREGLGKGLGFDDACAGIEVANEELRQQIIDDMLKVLIAEEHFNKNTSLEDLATRLKVTPERLEATRLEMLEDVKNSSLKALYQSMKTGNA
jgi:deoxyhypusine synthase